jgi:hypothetical protein
MANKYIIASAHIEELGKEMIQLFAIRNYFLRAS